MSSHADPPPNYDELMKQLKTLEHDGMTPDVKAKVYAAMAEETTSSKDDIVNEVKQLAVRAVATDHAFENIRVQLIAIDQHNFKDKFGNPIAKLQPTWVKYQKRYIDLLWRSRDAATITEAYLRDLTKVIIPLIMELDSTHEDNLKDLIAFKKRANPIKSTSHFEEDNFAKLQADVAAFTENFNTFAEDEGVKLSTQITALKNDIAGLQKELKDCDKIVTQMGIALGVTAGAVGIGLIVVSVAALGPAAPIAVVSILVAGIGAAIGEISQLIVALVRKAKIEGEIADKQREIEKANKQLKQLAEARLKLQRIAEEGGDFFGRLDSFTSIWDMAAQDADFISENNLAQIHTDKIAKARCQLVQASYNALADALAYYATAIDKSDLPPTVDAQKKL